MYTCMYIICVKGMYHTFIYAYVNIVLTHAHLCSVISLLHTIHAVRSTVLPRSTEVGTKSRENLPCPASKTAIRIFWWLQMWLGEVLISGDLGTIHTHDSCTVHYVCTHVHRCAIYVQYGVCTYIRTSMTPLNTVYVCTG